MWFLLLLPNSAPECKSRHKHTDDTNGLAVLCSQSNFSYNIGQQAGFAHESWFVDPWFT